MQGKLINVLAFRPPGEIGEEALDNLLYVDQAIGQTRFHWLRSAPDAPGASNLTGLIERIAFLRTLEIAPQAPGCRAPHNPK